MTAHAYRPRVGRIRYYASDTDAAAYEAGWAHYTPDAIGPIIRTPYYDGWWDRFDALERDAEVSLGLDCEDGDEQAA